MKLIRPSIINDAAFVSSNVTEADYSAWSAGTTYGLGDRAIYVVADTHWVIESLQAANTGHTPTGAVSDTWWLVIGNTNRWKMFDQYMQSQTSRADSIDVVLAPSGRIDSVALLNISAASVRIRMTDAVDGSVYDETYSLTSNEGISDWWAYFLEPIVRVADFSVSDLPPYSDPTLQITLEAAGDTVLCGVCIAGLSREIGGTQYGAQVGIQDYSIKQRDDFGNYTILERAYNKYAQLSVQIEPAMVDQLQRILSAYRATPIVYVGDDAYGATLVYGFYKDFSITIAYPTYSICQIELEGLT